AMSGGTACSRRLWRRPSRIAVSSCHGRPCHVERGGPRHGPLFVQAKGATRPSDSPGPRSERPGAAVALLDHARVAPTCPPGEAVTRLDELLAQLDLAAHGDGALGGDRPALAATLRRAAAQLERRGVEERRARLRRVGDDPPPPV